MKKHLSLNMPVLLAAVLLSCAFVLQGCGNKKIQSSGDSIPVTAAASSADSGTVASVETYNRTGKIQKEEFYGKNGTQSAVEYTVEYGYDDSGRLTEIRKTDGNSENKDSIGNSVPMETWFYSGNNATQHVLYDENGSTQKTWYWTYGEKNKKEQLTKERVVTMLASASGHGYSGKSEEITEYDETGLAKLRTYTAPGEWTKNEYGYDPNGNLSTDNYYCSDDGETWLLFETRSYFYNEAAVLTRETKKDGTGNIFYTKTYEYNTAGDPVCETLYNSGDLTEENCTFRCNYEYGDGGQCVFKISYSGADSVQTYYEYDGSGNCTCISETLYTDGVKKSTTVTKTQYDDRSNPVRETVTAPDGTVTVNFACEYEYYDGGQIKKKINYSTDTN